ncbi:MAG: hypothetical protein WC545_04510 [Patescibacteria group bacterium]
MLKFRKAEIKDFWLFIGIGVALIIFILILLAIPGIINLIVVWFVAGHLPPMSEADIIMLEKIKIFYSVSQWWNILFSVVWMGMVVWILLSDWVKKQAGRMRIIIAAVIFFGGIYFAILFGGIMYGLIFSSLFIILIPFFAAAIFLLVLIGDFFKALSAD